MRPRPRVRGLPLWPVEAALMLAGVVLVAGVACGPSAERGVRSVTTLEEPALALLRSADLAELPNQVAVPAGLRASRLPPPATVRATADAPLIGANPYIAQSVDVYAAGAAAQGMASLRATLAANTSHRMAFPAATGGMREQRVYIWSLAFPRLGDESYAIWFDASDGTTGALVAVRRGDVVSTIRQFSVGIGVERVDPRATERLVRQADERLAELLAR